MACSCQDALHGKFLFACSNFTIVLNLPPLLPAPLHPRKTCKIQTKANLLSSVQQTSWGLGRAQAVGRVHEDDLDWQGVNAALCKVAVTDPSAGVWCIALTASSSCLFLADSRASLAEQDAWALGGGFVQTHLWLRFGPEAGSEDPSGLGELVCGSCWDKCEPTSHCWCSWAFIQGSDLPGGS